MRESAEEKEWGWEGGMMGVGAYANDECVIEAEDIDSSLSNSSSFS